LANGGRGGNAGAGAAICGSHLCGKKNKSKRELGLGGNVGVTERGVEFNEQKRQIRGKGGENLSKGLVPSRKKLLC